MRETPPRVEKPWGYEDILERNVDFVVKRILLRAGNRSSLQLHERKREWVEVVEGTIELTMGTEQDNLEQMVLTAGDVYRVPPKTIHRVLAIDDALILEICTPGDDDIVRLDDDYGRRGQHATRATALSRLRGLWEGPRAHVAGIVLLLGLLAAAVLVGLANAVSLPQLHFMHADAFGLHQVAYPYVPAWDSFGFDPFSTGAIRLFTAVATVVYMASVLSLGTLVIRALRGSAQWPRPVRVLAAFLPGFLMVLAPLQLVFAALPLTAAAWTALIGVPFVAVFAHREALAALPTRVRTDAAYRSQTLRTGSWVVGVIFLAALWRLQAGRNFLVSDSVVTLLHAARDQLGGVFGNHLTQWDQQSDEWLFSGPLMFWSHGPEDFAFPLYITQSIGLASFAGLAFGLVHTLAVRRPRLTAGLATGGILAASPAAQPIYYISLVGGQNPALFIGHPGRYLGIVAPWAVLLLREHLHERRTLVALGLATTGLGFLSVHVAVYVVMAVVIALLWQRLPRRVSLSQRRPQLALHALAAIALATPFVVYAVLRHVGDSSPLGWLLLLGALIGMAGVALTALGSAPALASRAAPPARARVDRAVRARVRALEQPDVQDRDPRRARARPAGLRRAAGLARAARRVADRGAHVLEVRGRRVLPLRALPEPGGYIAAYGFISILAVAGWIALGRPDRDDIDGNRRRAAWLAMAAALCVSFILVDFTGASLGVAWILTRFIEVPYYGLLALATITLVGARDRLTVAAGVLAVGAWTIVPLVYNLVPLQLIKNADWLVGIVSK